MTDPELGSHEPQSEEARTLPAALRNAGSAGRQRLNEFELTVRAHADYFTALLETQGSLLGGAGEADGGRAQLVALAILRLELENLLEALDTAVNRRHAEWLTTVAQRLPRALELTGGSGKVVALLGPLLPLASEINNRGLLLQVQLGICRAVWQVGRIDDAREMLSSALEVAREQADLSAEARALNALGVLEHLQGNYRPALALHNQALELSRLCGDKQSEISCLTNCSIVKFLQGDFAAARAAIEDALAMRIANGDLHGQSNALHNVAVVDIGQGEHATARERILECLAIQRRLGDRRGQALSLSNLAYVEHALGRLELVEELQLESLGLHHELGDVHSAAYSLAHLGILADVFSRHLDAAAYHHEALAIRIEQGDISGQVTSAGLAGVTLARLGRFDSAAVILYAARHQLDTGIGDEDGMIAAHITGAFSELESAAAEGGPPEEMLAHSRSAALGMSVEDLASYAVAELRKLTYNRAAD